MKHGYIKDLNNYAHKIYIHSTLVINWINRLNKEDMIKNHAVFIINFLIMSLNLNKACDRIKLFTVFIGLELFVYIL